MRRLLILIALLLGCGSRAIAPATTPAATVAAVPGKPAARAPSEAIATHWPFAASPQLVAYADVAGFRASPLAASLVSAVVESAADLPGTAATHSCVAAIWLRAREVALGGGTPGFVTLVRFDGAPPWTACLAMLGGTPTPLEGATQALDLGDGQLAALQGDLVAVGKAELVIASLADHGARTPLPALALAGDEFVAGRLEFDEPRISARGSLVAAADRFQLGFEGVGPEGFAEMLERDLADALGSDVVRSNETLARLAKEVSVTRWGSHLRAAFEAGAPPAGQAKDVFAAATVTIAFVRHYLTEAKRAEARLEIAEIAHQITAWLESDDPADPAGKLRWKKKLFSLPPVPVAIPGSTKSTSSAADWKPWERIHYAKTGPQYWQYEVTAAKDGASVDIVARGDLNGNGAPSTLRRTLTIDRTGHRVLLSPEVAEGDSEE